MNTRLLNYLENFRSSFWFVPSILMFSAVAGAFLMVNLDAQVELTILEAFPFLELSPSAARSILSSIVGAMISSTGVVFSMTIVALSLASSQFGSRLIRTYRSRRSTHFTLGIFVSTSLYCILVLASIRDTDLVFVPLLSVGLGILLTLVCLSTLIYYIHDMSYAIQASSVISKSASDLHNATQRLFPTKIGEAKVEASDGQPAVDESDLQQTAEGLGEPLWTVLCEKQVGYVQAIENESVLKLARKHDLVIRLLLRPGDFVYHGREIANVYVCSAAKTSIEDDEKVQGEVRACLIVGTNRTPTEDIQYAFNEIVEIAVRALSPGINDPFTAINCVDRIMAALCELKEYEAPSQYRADEEGALRVIADCVPFETCYENSLGVIEHYASNDPMVLKRIQEASEVLAAHDS